MTDRDVEALLSPFSSEEIRKAVRVISRRKATGLSGLTADLLIDYVEILMPMRSCPDSGTAEL